MASHLSLCLSNSNSDCYNIILYNIAENTYNMIIIKDKSDCCGCTACASICVHDAITMQPDALGFLYPVVDKEKCVDCGVCEKVCAFNDHYDTSLNLPQPDAYAARHKDITKLRYSRSGAAFVAFSDYILDKGGVVYGAGYKDHFVVVHKRATTKEERDEFRGSKYVQSDMTGIFRNVKNDLKTGRLVLFSGTPCQTAGLKSYIGNRLCHNLILIDIICHSVPSPTIWKDYLAYVEKKCKSRVISLEFRDKSIGWYQTHLESFKLANGKTYKDYKLRVFFNLGLGTRPSCECCKFCNLSRPSDITIGDFWGYEKIVPEMNEDNKGISLVLCNTTKGQEILREAAVDLIFKKVPLEKCLQPNLQQPSEGNSRKNEFAFDYEHKGFDYVIKKYGNGGIINIMREFCRKVLRKIVRL